MERKPLTIAVLARKGGVGKSTVCILLHEAMRRASVAVKLHDWDAQGTSTKALDVFGSRFEGIPSVAIYDTPPNLEHVATGLAVRQADIILVVSSPSPADIWEGNAAVKFAQTRNGNAKIRAMVNKVRRTTILGRLMEESIKELDAPMLPTTLSARECYQHAVSQGWSALDRNAQDEVLKLTRSLLSFK